MKKRGGTDEDGALWEKVTRTVKAYRPKHRPDPAPLPAKAARPAAEKASSAAPARARITPATTPPPFDAGTAGSLRKKKWDIDRKTDLHGMRLHEAEEALVRFIRRAAAAECRTLLVITGKGNVKTGGGVIRRHFPLWLERADIRPLVLAFTPARIEDGGDGAFYIRLKKPKN